MSTIHLPVPPPVIPPSFLSALLCACPVYTDCPSLSLPASLLTFLLAGLPAATCLAIYISIPFCPSVCLSLYLTSCQTICASMPQPVDITFCPSVCMLACPPRFLFVSLPVCLPACKCLPPVSSCLHYATCLSNRSSYLLSACLMYLSA